MTMFEIPRVEVLFVHPNGWNYTEVDMHPSFLPRKGDQVEIPGDGTSVPVWVRKVSFDYRAAVANSGIPDVVVYTEETPSA